MGLSTSEGLEVGGKVVDPSTDAGFAAVLESRGFEPDAESTPSRNVAEGITTAESVQPGRDPVSGKFVSNQEAAAANAGESQQVAAGSSTEDATSSDDPILAEFLARHNGDTDAALKAAAHAQTLLGRQANEVGEARKENQELRERLARIEGQLSAAPAAPALTPDQVIDTAANLTATVGHYQAALTAINTLGNESVYDAVISEWAGVDPIQAQRFDLDYQLYKREQAATPATATADPWQSDIQTQAMANALANDFSVVEAEYGGKEAFAPILGHMETALESMPKNVQAMLGSPDPEARQEGIRLTADRAARLAAAQGGAPAAQATPTPEQQAAVVQRKLTGQVATSAARPAPSPATTPQSREEAIAAFKREIVETETTSVRDGLTYGDKLPGYSPR